MARVVHFEIHASDMDRAERFYTQVFGWEVQRWEGPVDYRLVTTGPDDQRGIDGAIVERSGEIGGTAATGFVCTIQVESLVAILEGMVAALVPAIVILVRHGRAGRTVGFPYAPFLALGSVVALFL